MAMTAGTMTDLFGAVSEVPAQRFKARLARLMIADAAGFETRDVERLALELDGIPGDRHRGVWREADSRVPWYPRGTPIRNTRQVSLLAPDELAEIARRLGLATVEPSWIGANMVLEGVPRLTRLPPGTRLHFPGGASLAVEGENMPCRHAGAAVAAHAREPGSGTEGLDLAFVKAAKGLRGLVAWVERAGVVEAGAEVDVRVPAQRMWER